MLPVTQSNANPRRNPSASMKLKQIFLIQLDSQKRTIWTYTVGYPKGSPLRFHFCWLETLCSKCSSKPCLSASRKLLHKYPHCCRQPSSHHRHPTNNVVLLRQLQSIWMVDRFLKVSTNGTESKKEKEMPVVHF